MGGRTHQFGSFCYLFPTGRVPSSAFIFSRLQLLEIYIAFVWSMIIQSSTQRPYGLFTSFAYRTVLLRNLHSARTGFIFTQLPYGPFEFNTVRYFFETFIQPVRVSFLHNYRTVFWMQYSKGVYRTVQYFSFTYKGRGFLALWLDPTPFSLGHACSHVLPQSHHFQPDPPKMSC